MVWRANEEVTSELRRTWYKEASDASMGGRELQKERRAGAEDWFGLFEYQVPMKWPRRDTNAKWLLEPAMQENNLGHRYRLGSCQHVRNMRMKVRKAEKRAGETLGIATVEGWAEAAEWSKLRRKTSRTGCDGEVRKEAQRRTSGSDGRTERKGLKRSRVGGSKARLQWHDWVEKGF